MRNLKSLTAYTFSHFSVDFACFFILFADMKKTETDLAVVSTAFLLYNAIAFGLQPIIGFACDRFPRIPVGLIGCVIVAVGVIAIPFSWFSLAFCALGNAFFHIGGGIDSLKLSDGRMARSGIFVSTGALGVVSGTLFGQSEIASVYLPLSLLLVSIILIAVFALRPIYDKQKPVFHVSSDLALPLVLLLALVSVVIRSFAGVNIPMQWKNGSALFTVLPFAGACIGKAVGGFLGDRFGAKTVGTASLLLSIPLLLLGNTFPAVSVTGIVLFNVTMPVTLCIVASRFPEHPGLAFGLTTLALLCGNVPTFFLRPDPAAASIFTGILTAVSALCVFISAKNQKGVLQNEKVNQPL